MKTRSLHLLIAIAAGMVVIGGVYVLDRAEQRRFQEEVRVGVLEQLSTLRARLDEGLSARLFLARALQTTVAANPNLTDRQFRSIAASLSRFSRPQPFDSSASSPGTVSGIRTILLAKDLKVSHVYPYAAGPRILGRDLLEDSLQERAIRSSIDKKQIEIVCYSDTLDDEDKLCLYLPIFQAGLDAEKEGSRLWGVEILTFDMTPLLQSAGFRENPDIRVALRRRFGSTSDEVPFFGSASVFNSDPVTLNLNLPSRVWELAAVPREGWPRFAESTWQWRSGGGLLALLVGTLVWLLLRAPERLRRAVRDATAALRESERRYRSLVELFPDSVTLTSPGRIDFINPAGAALVGADSPQQVLGRNPFDFIHPDSREIAERIIRNGGRGSRGNAPVELKVRRIDGEIIDAEVRSTALKRGGEAAILSVARDITERKRADEALGYRVEIERLIAAISTRFINVTPDEIDEAIREALESIGRFAGADASYIAALHDDGTLISMTHEWVADGIRARLNGYQNQPATNFPWFMGKLRRFEPVHVRRLEDLPPEADGERQILEATEIRSCLAVPIVHQKHLMGYLGYGSERPAQAWSEEDAAFLKIIGEILANAMERKRAEEVLIRSEASFRTLIENTPDAIIVHRRNQITYVNPAALALLGYDIRADLIGRSELDIVHPADHALVGERSALLQSGKKTPACEMRFMKRDGSMVHVEAVGLLLVFDGKLSFIGILRDLTENKKSEQERKRLEAQLGQVQKMEAIGTLAGGVAHDFNNLLAGILGYSNMLKSSPGSRELVLKAADVIERAAGRAADLTKQLLGFARRGKLQNTQVDLHNTIHEVAMLLSRTVDKNISLVERFHAPVANVMGDPSQMQQVILNLAVNARDAMPHGGKITFETELIETDDIFIRSHPDAARGRFLRLCISDTGTGIPKELQSRIFEPFFTTKELGKGTGMGLAMVYGTVKNHGGFLHLYSEAGMGTTFQVYLPIAREVEAASKEAKSAEPIHGRGRILVIDDEDIVRETLGDMLKNLGYDVLTAIDGQDAIDCYRRHMDEIDLAIIDMIMPRLGGLDCFRALKAINPELKAVLSTGYGKDGAAQEILDEGMRGFAQKPYRLNELSEVVSNALR